MKFYHEYNETEDPEMHYIFQQVTHEYKYRIMWELRHLESRINEEKGIIIFNKHDEIEVKGFSDELGDEIIDTVSKIDFTRW